MISNEQLQEVADKCGRHIAFGNSTPLNNRARQLWGLAEILDFECCQYGDAPGGITKEEAQEYLLAHKAEFLSLTDVPPSNLGLSAGVYDFLFATEEQGIKDKGSLMSPPTADETRQDKQAESPS